MRRDGLNKIKNLPLVLKEVLRRMRRDGLFKIKKMDFKKLDKKQLENLLKDLKFYNDLKKKLGNRGMKLFKRNMNNTSKLEVEYFPSINDDIAYENASEVYKKVFDINPKKEEINFISKKSIGGGIKIYKDDNMVDFSFSKVQNILQK